MINGVTKQLHFFILIMMAILLSGCFSKSVKKDGPPNFYVDVSKIPNAEPKPERLASYGNMPYYYVFGKRYHTMKTSKNYDEIGVASWYGTKFHARRTSSGERYNMLAMTAAHKTLPLPTYVEVTNLKNQRKIIVKVNDRGPFKNNRIIDLSYVAAKKLNMFGHGTATVRVRAIDPVAYQRSIWLANNSSYQSKRNMAIASKNKINHPVYLQVGTFRQKSNAERLKKRLITVLGAPVNISPAASKKHYKVQVGPIRDIATRNKIAEQLKHFGINPVASQQISVPAWDPLQRNGS